MLTTLAFLAALSAAPGRADELALTHVRPTYGILGPRRTAKAVLPGDSVFVTFDIEGITTDKDGKVLYSVATEVSDSSGKVHFTAPARDLEAIAALGGNTLPAFVHVDIGLEQPAGEYTFKLTVTDRASGKSKSLSHQFQVLPKAFGIVRLTTTSDAEGLQPVGILGTGQSLWVHLAAVGFSRNGDKSQPNVAFELRVIDADGKPTIAKPFSGVVNKDVPAKAPAVPVQFHLALNRAGKYTVEVKATDQVSGKTATESFPITVLENK
jgi:hypothetical protein